MIDHTVATVRFTTQPTPPKVNSQHTNGWTQACLDQTIERMCIGSQTGHKQKWSIIAKVVQIVQLNTVYLNQPVIFTYLQFTFKV